jgi:hypothetical protein
MILLAWWECRIRRLNITVPLVTPSSHSPNYTNCHDYIHLLFGASTYTLLSPKDFDKLTVTVKTGAFSIIYDPRTTIALNIDIKYINLLNL